MPHLWITAAFGLSPGPESICSLLNVLPSVFGSMLDFCWTLKAVNSFEGKWCNWSRIQFEEPSMWSCWILEASLQHSWFLSYFSALVCRAGLLGSGFVSGFFHSSLLSCRSSSAALLPPCLRCHLPSVQKTWLLNHSCTFCISVLNFILFLMQPHCISFLGSQKHVWCVSVVTARFFSKQNWNQYVVLCTRLFLAAMFMQLPIKWIPG